MRLSQKIICGIELKRLAYAQLKFAWETWNETRIRIMRYECGVSKQKKRKIIIF